MRNSVYHPDIKPYMTDHIWFNLDVANAYDTRAFGHTNKDPYEGITWIEFYKRQGINWIPPDRVSLQRYLMTNMRQHYSYTSLKVNTQYNYMKNATIDNIHNVIERSMPRNNILVSFVVCGLSFIYWTVRANYYLILIPYLRKLKQK